MQPWIASLPAVALLCSGFVVSAGCPDADADGICDDVDNCPGTPNPGQSEYGVLGGDELGVLTPDGATVVYRAQNAGTFELYQVPAAGGTPVKLNPSLVAGGEVGDFVISPDGMHVVYDAIQDTAGVRELYAVPIGGGSVTKLNLLLPPGGQVFPPYEISPDSSTVVYVANELVDDDRELFAVPIAGGASTKLSAGSFDYQANFLDFVMSPDGQRVVYRLIESFPTARLFSNLITGGTSTRLGDSDLDEVRSFEVSPDSQRVVFVNEEANVEELFSTPIVGGVPTQLTGPLPAGATIWEFQISPDSAYVVYRANPASSNTDLFSIGIDGGLITQINDPLHGRSVTVVRITPDSQQIVYRADASGLNDELRSAPITGGGSTQLVGPNDDVIVANPQVNFAVQRFELTPDGQTLLFSGVENGITELFALAVTGGVPTRLNAALAANQLFEGRFYCSPDSQAVAYEVWTEIDMPYGSIRNGDLVIAPLGGGATQILNPILEDGGAASAPVFAPDGSRVLFFAPVQQAELSGNFAVNLPVQAGGLDRDFDGAGGACDCDDTASACAIDCADRDQDGFCGDSDCDESNPVCNGDCSDSDGDQFCDESDNCPTIANPTQLSRTLRINGEMTAGGDASTTFFFDPTSQRVVYLADEEVDGRVELFSAPIDGGGSVKLNGVLPELGSVQAENILVDPTGQRVVYLADQDTLWTIELYSVPIGGGPSIRLNGPVVDEGGVLVNGVALSPDGSTVVYLARQIATNRVDLFSVPVGGGAVTHLTPTLLMNREATGFQITPDGTQVVFRADLEAEDKYELFVVPIAGGTTVKLNEPLPAAGDVLAERFAITPDGMHVLYVADPQVDDEYALFRVPVGGGPAFLVSDPIPAGADVTFFRISPDSTRAVFLVANPLEELYSSSLTTAGATKLNPTLATGGTVNDDFQISPDGARVVYRALQNDATRRELYSVPINGGTAVALNRDLRNFSTDVFDFDISQDGQYVVFRQGLLNTVAVLWSASITGEGVAIGLTRSDPPPAYSVRDVVISSDSSRVFYSQNFEGPDFTTYERVRSTPIDRRLESIHTPLLPWRSTQSNYTVAPDGQHVAYRADQYTFMTFELYRSDVPDDAARDGDGDGRGGACDCSDGINSVWAIPGEAQQLDFVDAETLTWQAPNELGGWPSSIRYETLRSIEAFDFDSMGECIETSGTDTMTTDPSVGTIFFYLVRAENSCGGGTLGAGAAGERMGLTCLP